MTGIRYITMGPNVLVMLSRTCRSAPTRLRASMRTVVSHRISMHLNPREPGTVRACAETPMSVVPHLVAFIVALPDIAAR